MSTVDTVAPDVAPTATPPRKVGIIGKAPSSVGLAPYGDPGWEIWILNTLGHANQVPRWDRQFVLHDLGLTKAKEYGDYYQWLSRQTRPVFLRDAPPADFKAGVQFPLGQILEHFTHLAGKTYLTNTVSGRECVSYSKATLILPHSERYNRGVPRCSRGRGERPPYRIRSVAFVRMLSRIEVP